jgi:hypothetical protein
MEIINADDDGKDGKGNGEGNISDGRRRRSDALVSIVAAG